MAKQKVEMGLTESENNQLFRVDKSILWSYLKILKTLRIHYLKYRKEDSYKNSMNQKFMKLHH